MRYSYANCSTLRTARTELDGTNPTGDPTDLETFKATRDGSDCSLVAHGAVSLKLPVPAPSGSDASVTALGVYVRSLSGCNRRPRTGSGGGPAERYVRSSMTSTTSRRRSSSAGPKTDPADAQSMRRRSRSHELVPARWVWSTIERPLGSQLSSARETPRPAELAEGRPSRPAPHSSRAVDVPAALQPTYVVSVVRPGRVNVAGAAVTSTTCR